MDDSRAGSFLVVRLVGDVSGSSADRGRGEQKPAARSQTSTKRSVPSTSSPEERAEREPAPEAEAEEAQRLAAAVLRREVGDHRRRADEDHRLPEPGDEPERDQERERVGERVAGDARRRDERSGDDEDSPAVPISDASGDRLRHEDHRADGSD